MNMSKENRFRVFIKGKMRYYSEIEDIAKDLSIEEIKDSEISVIYGSVIIGEINSENLAGEIAYEKRKGN